tara:strand:- start:410 stop:766 length:357 start_codon:yes stop_codon:yes gene_type:complete
MLSKDMYTLVNEFGQEVTFRKVVTGAYNPSTGSAGNTTTDYTVKSYMAQFILTELSLDTVVRGDRKALLSAYDTSGVAIPSPDEGDLLVGVGDTVRVVSLQTIYSGSSAVCYICQVRE